MKIIQGIQWVLRQVYTIVNINYMALSREMEFHADEVAANVAGSKPLARSLLRMGLADNAYNSILDFYSEKINEAKIAANIYPQHRFVMDYLASRHQVPYQNNLPAISIQFLNRFNKSKLNIKDQWASHPNVEDRIAQLDRLNIETPQLNDEPANTLFDHLARWQQQLTQKLFSTVKYEQPTSVIEAPEFIPLYEKRFGENNFGKRFNYYYDYKNPARIELSFLDKASSSVISFEELYSNDKADMVVTVIALEQDIATLRQIENRELKVKTFDYDGTRYQWRDAGLLIPRLEKEKEQLNSSIKINDENICRYFFALAEEQDKKDIFNEKYSLFVKADADYDDYAVVYEKIVPQTEFISQTTPFEIIERKLRELQETEQDFKEKVSTLLYQAPSEVSTPDFQQIFEKYLAENWVYFANSKYNNDALEVLFAAIRAYPALISKNYFFRKKDLLNLFEELEQQRKH